MVKKIKSEKLDMSPPPSACSWGCFPCNLYCFARVAKQTEILRREAIRNEAVRKALAEFGVKPYEYKKENA